MKWMVLPLLLDQNIGSFPTASHSVSTCSEAADQSSSENRSEHMNTWHSFDFAWDTWNSMLKIVSKHLWLILWTQTCINHHPSVAMRMWPIETLSSRNLTCVTLKHIETVKRHEWCLSSVWTSTYIQKGKYTALCKHTKPECRLCVTEAVLLKQTLEPGEWLENLINFG